MKDPFRKLEEIQRDIGDVAVAITRTHFIHFNAPNAWQPAINAFRCGEKFVICAELAGVDKNDIDVRAEPRALIIGGVRRIAEPSCDEAPAVQVLALEIDHGRFERVIELPTDVDPERVTAEHRDGLLWIKLPVRTHG
jgi:HSP20 family protein